MKKSIIIPSHNSDAKPRKKAATKSTRVKAKTRARSKTTGRFTKTKGVDSVKLADEQSETLFGMHSLDKSDNGTESKVRKPRRSMKAKAGNVVTKINKKVHDINANGTKFFKKVTPKYDLSWYIKWTASLLLIIAAVTRGNPDISVIYDLIFSMCGVGGWFIVGMMWHDRALITLNSVLFVILAGGLIAYI